MASQTYNSADTPITANYVGMSTITIAETFNADSLSVTVNVTAPDEGSGPDASLLAVALNHSDGNSSLLQASDPSSLAGVNFEGDRPTVSGLTQFLGVPVNGTWDLFISTFSDFSFTINSWALNFTYTTAPNTPRFPNDPAAITIAPFNYGKGASIKKNARLNFNVSSPTVSSIFDSLRVCAFNARVEGLIVNVKSSGTGNTTLLSLHKVSGTTDTILLSQTIQIPAGNSYYYRYFPSVTKQIDNGDLNYDKNVNKGDFLYFSIEQLGTNVADINASVILNSRD